MKKYISLFLMVIFIVSVVPITTSAAESVPIKCNLNEIVNFTKDNGTYNSQTGAYVYLHLHSSGRLSWQFTPGENMLALSCAFEKDTGISLTGFFFDLDTGRLKDDSVAYSYYFNNGVAYDGVSYINRNDFAYRDNFNFRCYSNVPSNAASDFITLANIDAKASMKLLDEYLYSDFGINLGDIGFVNYSAPTYKNPTTGHLWMTNMPVKGDDGCNHMVCANCGYMDPTPLHKTVKTPSKEPTCTESGNSEYYTCTICGKISLFADGTEETTKERVTIPATGHSYGEWTITKEATATSEGTRTRTCTKCGNKETETIPKKDSSSDNDKNNSSDNNGQNNGNNPPTSDHYASCPSAKYVDVNISESNWTHLPIDYVLEKGYMAGVSETMFEPNTSVSRAMVVQVLYAMEGKPIPYKSVNFTDVVAGKWYEDAINWAASHNIVAGYTDGRFGVNDPVKRQDLVAIMYKYSLYKGYASETTGDISIFADRSSISAYAVNGMSWGVGHGIISGMVNGTRTYAEPKSTATRAQLAVILKAFDQNVKK